MTTEQPYQHSAASSIRNLAKGTPSLESSKTSGITLSIVAYETSAEELRKLLHSLARSRRRVDVTVVDNSPTEMLRPVVEAFGITYLPAGENLGFGGGHNLAMQVAIRTSKYHVVCNPDITCGIDVLGELEYLMDSQPDVGLAMPQILYPDGREQRLCKMLPTPMDLLVRRFLGKLGEKVMRRSGDRYQMRNMDFRVAREVPSLSGCFMFLRTSVLRETGLFDPRFFLYMEDVDLCRRVGAVSQTVYYPAVSVTHGYAKGSYKNRQLMFRHMTSAVRYFSKWGWIFDPGRRALNRRTEILQAARREQATLSAVTYAGTR